MQSCHRMHLVSECVRDTQTNWSLAISEEAKYADSHSGPNTLLHHSMFIYTI